jgi:hypothetical protein
MPKARIAVKNAKNPGIRTKCKIGGRKMTKSMFTMKDDELLEAYTAPNTRGRDRQKIKRMMDSRGLSV